MNIACDKKSSKNNSSTRKMMFHLHLLLAGAVNANRFRHYKMHRMLDKKGGVHPTMLPTLMPTETPTISPTTQRHIPDHQQALTELCDKENADKLDLCIEYFTSEAPSAVPSDAPCIQPSTVVLSSDSPTVTPTKDMTFESDHNSRILIELDYFDMSITIVAGNTTQLRSRDTNVQYRQGVELSRQYEHEAAKQHLHEVYTANFLNPLTSFNLTFIDRGETNEPATRTRNSIFFGSVEFEQVEGYSDPSLSEVNELIISAFAGDQKNRFLEEFRRYWGIDNAETYVYDVIVQKMNHSHGINPTSDIIKDNEGANRIVPIIGIGVGVLLTCIAGLVLFARREKSKSQRQTQPKSPSPMRQILQSKRTGEFDSNNEEIVNIHCDNLDGAYMDSASIQSW